MMNAMNAPAIAMMIYGAAAALGALALVVLAIVWLARHAPGGRHQQERG